ncbi:MAG: NAD(P)/FAD-dependent oxidoreductase [Dehalococcoidia bacterium]
MRERQAPHDIVVGSGPNGLAAAIALAQAGRSVTVFEASETPGGGSRSAEVTLPGFVHDICSAVHAFGAASPYFRTLPLRDHGLDWVHPDLPLAHPLDGGEAVVLERSLTATARGLGPDGASYHRLFAPLVAGWDELAAQLLGPMLRPPRHPLLLARFGLSALRSARSLARRHFKDEPARALFAGIAAHATLPLDQPLTASFALVLATAGHSAGWPFARGGSQRVADALVAHLGSLGGEVITGTPVSSLDELSPARAFMLDVTPRQVVEIAGTRLPAGYRRALERYRYGGAAFKIDYALDAPIPWQAEACRRAGTVHVGGTMDEIAAAERAVARGEHPDRPYVIVAQPSLFDSTRAPEGKHTAWTYCHVPNGSTVDMTERIEAQIERFAPGFRDRVLARSVLTPAQLQQYNANYVGGDIAGGSAGGLQLFFRPTRSASPYRTPAEGVYICSSSTPPGPGVHGMCGYWAARAALARSVKRR